MVWILNQQTGKELREHVSLIGPPFAYDMCNIVQHTRVYQLDGLIYCTASAACRLNLHPQSRKLNVSGSSYWDLLKEFETYSQELDLPIGEKHLKQNQISQNDDFARYPIQK